MDFRFLVSAPMLLLATIAFAQEQSIRVMAGQHVSSVSAVGGFPASEIAGQPYSAERVYENVRTLADGTHIKEGADSGKMYRDSQGRTRTENSMPVLREQKESPAPMMIQISDPVAHVMYFMNTAEKIAHRSSMPSFENQMSRPDASVAHTSTTHSTTATSSASHIRGKVEVEKLGTQTMEGVMVEGVRRTTIWPAGSRGNDQPITEVHESWTSPELKVTVLSIDTSPLTGDTTIKLINISRAEPDPSLFQPPPDYQIVDGNINAR